MRCRVSAWTIFLALLWLAGVAVAGAHGIGKPQILNADTGPYLISVWTDPDPLRADEAHIVVAVINPETREPIVTEVVVNVRMRSLERTETLISQTAESDDTNLLLFAAEFNDQVTDGRWEVGVAATGDRGIGEEVTFEVSISPARGFNLLWIGIGGLAVLVIAWVVSMGRGKPAGAPPQRGKQRAR